MSTLLVDGAVLMGPTAGDPFTQNYTPTWGDLAGVLFLGGSLGSTTPRDFAVSYGGVAMTQLPGSPLTGDFSEDCNIYAWFLGSGIPTGTQEILVDFNDGALAFVQARVYGIYSTGGNDTFVEDTGTTNNSSLANPSASLTTTRESLPFGMLISGHDAVGSVAAGADYNENEQDRGTSIYSWVEYAFGSEGVQAPAGTFDVNWTAAAESALIYAVAIAENHAGGTESDHWGTF